MTKPFTSCFAQHLAEYVALRQRLGLKFERQSAILYWFDRYLSETAYQGPLTQELVMTFVTHNPAISAGERANRYSTIEHFSRYYAAYVPDTPVVSPSPAGPAGARRSWRSRAGGRGFTTLKTFCPASGVGWL